MLKTNNKKVKVYFDEHLNNILIDDFYGNIDHMVNQFFNDASDRYGKLYHGYKTYQDAFITITHNHGAIYYDDMREILKDALEQTDEQANKYNNDKVEHLYNYLLYMAYLRRCEKENINPYKFRIY